MRNKVYGSWILFILHLFYQFYPHLKEQLTYLDIWEYCCFQLCNI